jgi:hypothetical protein
MVMASLIAEDPWSGTWPVDSAEERSVASHHFSWGVIPDAKILPEWLKEGASTTPQLF